MDFHDTGVALTLVSLGATATDFVTTANATSMRVYQSPSNISPEDIAKLAFKNCQAGKANAIPGVFNKILAFLEEMLSRFVAFKLFAFLFESLISIQYFLLDIKKIIL